MWKSAYHLDIHVPSFLVKYTPTHVSPSLEMEARYISLSKVTVPLPIDSIVIYVFSIALVENPELLPSYLFFFCGWALTAVLHWRQRHPNPWYHTLSFREGVRGLVTGEALEPELNIACDENKICIDEFNSLWEQRFKLAKKRADLTARRTRKQRQQIADEMEEFGGTPNLTTKKNTLILNHINPKYQTLNLLKPHIYPYQQQLLIVCEWLRIFRNGVTWEEYYFSLYISISCFLLAVISFFIPWAFIIKWSARLVVWILFGPWLKLWDYYKIFKETKSLSACYAGRLVEIDLDSERRKWEENTHALVKAARITKENAIKKDLSNSFYLGGTW